MDRSLYKRATTFEALTGAWHEVLANDIRDGELQPAIQRFSTTAEQALTDLTQALADGSYSPSDLMEVTVPKDNGERRLLHIPSVRDRIVERALLRLLGPLLDPILGPTAYAFRPGLGVKDAVQAVASLRDEGHAWVVHTDIHDCFPSIAPDRVTRILSICLPEQPELIELIRQLLSRCAVGDGGRGSFPGLPQGSPLSPMFSNLVLRQFDDAILRSGYPLVRYADDLVITCRTEAGAHDALRTAGHAIKELDMELGDDKTEVMSFEEGFCFLGEDFGPRYPPTLDDHRVREPESKTIYVGLQGSRVRVSRGRLVVESADKVELLSVAQSQVKRIVCFGSVGVSAGARDWALSASTDVVFASRRGAYQGQLIGAKGKKRVGRLRAQLNLPPERSLAIARSSVDGKLNKQAVLLKRFTREGTGELLAPRIAEIDYLIGMLSAATSLPELMGLEGAGAKAYFAGLGAILPPDVGFTGRNRQPPLDVANAALSFGYTLLLGECVSAIVATGLDPSIGCLHSAADNKPSLALDLCEEFRPWVVDQVVVEALRRGTLTAAHGYSESGKPGVLLTKAGRQALIGAYERRMLRTTKGAMPDFAGSIRRHLYRQAQRLNAAIMGDTDAYQGLSWR